MNILGLIIASLQLLATLVYHLIPQFFPAWALVIFFALSSSALMVFHKVKSLPHRYFTFGVTLTSLGLAALMIYGPVIRYLGYGLTISGLLVIVIATKNSRGQRKMIGEVIALIITAALMAFLSLVIVPPPPINIPALFSFVIGGIFITLIVIMMIGKLRPPLFLAVVLLAGAFLFSGLEVVLKESDHQSILVTIVQSPLHLGVITLLIAITITNFEAYGITRTKNHSL